MQMTNQKNTSSVKNTSLQQQSGNMSRKNIDINPKLKKSLVRDSSIKNTKQLIKSNINVLKKNSITDKNNTVSRKDAIATSSPNISQITAANTSQQSVIIKPLKAGAYANSTNITLGGSQTTSN